MLASSPMSIAMTVVRRYGPIVAIGGLIGGFLAGITALMTPKQWTATQQLIVRDELVGDDGRTGRFASLEEMRSLEETVRTVIRSHRVIGSALRQLEPPSYYTRENWPDQEFVEDFRSKVSVTAPNGAEFGQTEVIQLHVTERSPERAIATLEQLAIALRRELADLRKTRLIGIEKELSRSLQAADRTLQIASTELAELEKRVGIDLAELRSMTDTNGSEGPLAKQLGQTRQDRVQLEQRAGELQTHLQHLDRLIDSPESIVSTPESLLAIHPELRRLKESIIDSAVTLAQLRAQYDVQHPRVLAAAEVDRQLARELQNQLQAAYEGTKLEIELNRTRQTQLESVENRLSERMVSLTQQRVTYAELAHRVEQRKTQRALIEAEWADVRGALEETEGADIASPLGTPIADTHPAGPGRTTIALGGVAAGIALALAAIALTLDPKTLRQAFLAAPQQTETPDLIGQLPTTPASGETSQVSEGPVLGTTLPATAFPSPAFPSTAFPSTAIPAKTLSDSRLTAATTSDALPGTGPQAKADSESVSPSPAVLSPEALARKVEGVKAEPDSAKWRALAELSDEIAELKRSIERRRAAALADELGRYGSTPSS